MIYISFFFNNISLQWMFYRSLQVHETSWMLPNQLFPWLHVLHWNSFVSQFNFHSCTRITLWLLNWVMIMLLIYLNKGATNFYTRQVFPRITNVNLRTFPLTFHLVSSFVIFHVFLLHLSQSNNTSWLVFSWVRLL